jgi:hypothetical protein
VIIKIIGCTIGMMRSAQVFSREISHLIASML